MVMVDAESSKVFTTIVFGDAAGPRFEHTAVRLSAIVPCPPVSSAASAALAVLSHQNCGDNMAGGTLDGISMRMSICLRSVPADNC